jgi:hypothetical protein
MLLPHPRRVLRPPAYRRLVREALQKIAVENGGPHLEQKMGASL